MSRVGSPGMKAADLLARRQVVSDAAPAHLSPDDLLELVVSAPPVSDQG